MGATTVMQRQSHDAQRPRFYVSSRGVLMDRGSGVACRTKYSLVANSVSRTEMQILADLLNEPAAMADHDAGLSVEWMWAERICERQRLERQTEIGSDALHFHQRKISMEAEHAV